MNDTAIWQWTLKRKLTDDEKNLLNKGANLREKIRFGLFVPELNKKFSEEVLQFTFNKRVRSDEIHFSQQTAPRLPNPCSDDYKTQVELFTKK